MRSLRTLVRAAALLTLLLPAAAVRADCKKFIQAELTVGDPNVMRIVVSCDSSSVVAPGDVVNLNKIENWKAYYRGIAIPIKSAAFNAQILTITLEYEDASHTLLPPFTTLKPGELIVSYRPEGGATVNASNIKAQGKANAGSKWDWIPKLTADKDKADIDLTGSLQTAISAKPLYFWSVNAAYPFNLPRGIGTVSPTFKGQASQQQNADPDSMKASATFEKVFAIDGARRGFIVDSDLIDYEFERTAKEEAVLVNGAAVENKYKQKNTNLLWTGTARFVTGWTWVNVTLYAGGEVGSALSRSVRKTGTTTDEDLQIGRTVVGIDTYKVFFRPKSDKQLFVFDGHYLLRSPFTPEPFKQAYVNGGNEFLTTKPRHYVNINGSFPFTKGASLTLQYKYGSLPPTFEFLDNQATIGVEILLSHH